MLECTDLKLKLQRRTLPLENLNPELFCFLKLTFKLFVVAHRKSCYAPKTHFSFVLVELLKCKNSAYKKRKKREVSRFI